MGYTHTVKSDAPSLGLENAVGVLGLHNECPPTDYAAAEAAEIAVGLVSDAVATGETLRTVRDCMEALASLDDTVRCVVEASAGAVSASGEFDRTAVAAKMSEVRGTYDATFAALAGTVAHIDRAIEEYENLQGYAAVALANGRDDCYENRLRQLGEGGFAGMAQARIAALRKLRVRVQLLQRMEPFGQEILEKYDFRSFFLMFMQPMRDLGVSAQELYNEVVRGALVAYDTLVRVCDMREGNAATTLRREMVGASKG
ncbi:hypothetical protein [Phytohabitans houttuyneae]|jgi:hypothetical protein|uniref:Uncharacterized protein n=1 Tax=Phytohabitans houttuyneae TaxID=1076126 RepID=A0A6V8K8J9_9ACTN|nr:hypothetical protein [Phytohabitans houttuyneae]GFJ81523.1 hypothetical protein Phou_057030 [Phytohabitans houttuyneae]